MSFSQLMDTAANWTMGHLPIVVGGAVAVLVLIVLYILNRRRHNNLGQADGKSNVLAEEKALNWAPPEHSYADRRGAVRREGQPVRVLLASPTFRGGVADGFVTDRSTGGLRIAMPAAIAPGSAMQVRAVNAPDTVGFVTLIVRSCRKSGDFFEVGCEFEKTPPWNVLLLFG